MKKVIIGFILGLLIINIIGFVNAFSYLEVKQSNSDASGVQVIVQRAAGIVDIVGMKFIFEMNDGTISIYEDNNLPKQLGTKSYKITPNQVTPPLSNFANLKNVSVLPIMGDGSNVARDCYDTDGGINLYVKGTITFFDDTKITIFKDKCINKSTLNEIYCDGNIEKDSLYPCPNGCEDGACIEKGEVRYQNDSENQGLGETIRNRVRAGVYTSLDGEEIRVSEMAQNKIRLRVKNISADCDCNLSEEQVQNRTRLKIHLSNGNEKEIIIMPDAASERALGRLKLKVCDESNNCIIELKEVGKGNQTRAAYELQVQKHYKLLGLFRAKAQARVQVDAENGEVIQVKKPWWSFLASESD